MFLCLGVDVQQHAYYSWYKDVRAGCVKNILGFVCWQNADKRLLNPFF
jgi:superoxide dismutase